MNGCHDFNKKGWKSNHREPEKPISKTSWFNCLAGQCQDLLPHHLTFYRSQRLSVEFNLARKMSVSDHPLGDARSDCTVHCAPISLIGYSSTYIWHSRLSPSAHVLFQLYPKRVCCPRLPASGRFHHTLTQHLSQCC